MSTYVLIVNWKRSYIMRLETHPSCICSQVLREIHSFWFVVSVLNDIFSGTQSIILILFAFQRSAAFIAPIYPCVLNVKTLHRIERNLGEPVNDEICSLYNILLARGQGEEFFARYWKTIFLRSEYTFIFLCSFAFLSSYPMFFSCMDSIYEVQNIIQPKISL